MLRGVKVHNLKSIDLDIPRRKLIVLLRTQRQRQEQPGAGHALRRRAAALHRELFRLHAAVPAAAGKARGRTDRRHPAGHRRDRQEHQPLQPLDRGHGHRSGRLSAAAVCQDRPRLLPQCGREVRCDTPAEHGRAARRPAGRARAPGRLRPDCPPRSDLAAAGRALREEGFVRAIVDGRMSSMLDGDGALTAAGR